MRIKKRIPICTFLLTVILFTFIGCMGKSCPANNASSVLEQNGNVTYVSGEWMKVDSESMPGEVFYYSGTSIWTINHSFFYKGSQVNEGFLGAEAEEYDQIEIRSSIWKQELETTQREITQFTDTKGYVLSATYGRQGDVWLLQMSTETYLGFDEKYFLVRFDKDGKESFRAILNECPGIMAVDGKGNVMIQTAEGMIIYDIKGKKRETLKSSEMLLAVCGDAEKGFYLIKTKPGGTGFARLLDGNEEELKVDCTNLHGLAASASGTVLTWNGTNLYEYSHEDSSLTKLCSWGDVGIYSGNVKSCFMDAERKIRIVTKETDGEYSITLEQRGDEEQGKKTITLGVWNPSMDVMQKVAAFNHENKEYAIAILDYSENINENSSVKEAVSARERIKLDVMSENGPDLIVVPSDMDLEAVANKGVFVDLYPYLEQSEILSRQDFFEEVLLSATRERMLLYLPDSFSISTIIVNANAFHERNEWTVDDMLKYAKDHQEESLFMPNYLGKDKQWSSGILHAAFARNSECMREQDEMDLTTLENLFLLAKKEYDNKTNIRFDDIPEAFRQGSILAEEVSILSFRDLQSYKRFYFGNTPFRVMGYPTMNGGSGHVLCPINGIAMTHSCKYKEGAFQFLEYYASNWNEESQIGFPANRKVFWLLKEKAIAYSEITPPEGTYNDYVKEDIITIEGLIDNAVGDYCLTDDKILKIIDEEMQAFYLGEKSVQEVIKIIKNRTELYVSENEN